MYKSLLPWVDIPCVIRPFEKRSGTGSKVFGNDVLGEKCYPEEKVEVVKNSQGKEIVSVSRLYMNATTVIKELDEVSYDGTPFREVVAVGAFYRAGKRDVLVVYL